MKSAVIAIVLLLTFSAIFTAEARPNLASAGTIQRGSRQVPALQLKCGSAYGSCGPGMCCSLGNECGNTIAHCNVSLGCKKKYGNCS